MARFKLLYVLLLLHASVYGQDLIKGKIYDKETDSVLSSVNVINLTGRVVVVSDKQGQYSIRAVEGDRIIFSATGYFSDTVKVEHYMFFTTYDVTLSIKPVLLRTVTVTASSYQTDSINRRQHYQYLYDHKEPGLTGKNTPQGFGISLSPVSYFSKEARQRRQLRKRMAAYEKEDFIDHQFSASMVSRTTGLKGDSLHLFMYRYRPSYSFCRKSSPEQMLLYISDKLKEFRNPLRKES